MNELNQAIRQAVGPLADLLAGNQRILHDGIDSYDDICLFAEIVIPKSHSLRAAIDLFFSVRNENLFVYCRFSPRKKDESKLSTSQWTAIRKAEEKAATALATNGFTGPISGWPLREEDRWDTATFEWKEPLARRSWDSRSIAEFSARIISSVANAAAQDVQDTPQAQGTRSGVLFEYLKNQADINSDDMDGSYELVREATRALQKIDPSSLGVEDLDMLYLLTIHTGSCTPAIKQKKIASSHLLPDDKARLQKLIDEVVARAKSGRYRHSGTSGNFGFFGKGFGTFDRGKKPYPAADARRFIRMCCDVVDLESAEEVLRIVGERLVPRPRNMGRGAVSQILHLLKPDVFPVLNSWGMEIISQLIETRKKFKLENYVEVSRRLIEERNKHFSFRNFIVIDQVPDEVKRTVTPDPPPEDNDDDDDGDSETLGTEVQKMQGSTNLILYGPPGTGKTYHSTRRALELLGESGSVDLTDDRAVTERFQALQREGRVAFVTFHQSYGYEDFVEGIRPVLDEAGASGQGAVAYEITPGVFRRICETAKEPAASRRLSGTIEAGAQSVWKLSLGNALRADDAWVFDSCVENGNVLLGYGYGMDFTDCPDREAIAQRHRERMEGREWTPFSVDAVDRFKNQMKSGDIVVVSHGNKMVRAVGRITGGYKYLGDSEYGQSRPAEWLRVLDESVPRDAFIDKNLSQQTIYKFKNEDLRFEALNRLLGVGGTAEPEDHVLIVDEINRGNISKIFGELITLLEPDKRIGQPNELRVTLPYSREPFAVPSNLHVIGTMNTADRSIALLDAALRRRFTFEEMMPDVELVKKNVGTIGDVDVGRLLEVMNARIRFLYDRDHQVGHSFFLKVRSLGDLRQVFVDSVIPLLQEYFYGSWDKICAVLGCPYDEKGSPAARRKAGASVKLKYSVPLVVATPLGETATLGYDHPDYESDKLDFEVNPEFSKAPVEALRAFFYGILAPSFEAETEGEETVQ